ncbi:MAG TPA: hypothetical protein VFE46_12645 [Pirellulales bacterium]|nr:hypothetical protein [Pirellulales bacterium]
MESWQVCEIVNADGLPVRVIPLRIGDELPALEPGESLSWLAAACLISGNAARRLASERLKMIGRWNDGQPEWLRQRVPSGTGKQPPRPVYRQCAGGVQRFPSIRLAAKSACKSRRWLHLRLIDGFADCDGCTWHDDFDGETA